MTEQTVEPSDTEGTPSEGTSSDEDQLSLEIAEQVGDLEITTVTVTDIERPSAVGPDSSLRKSLESFPFFSSVTLRRRAEDEGGRPYKVVAGRRRVALAIENEVEEVPAVVLPPEARHYADLLALAENVARDPDPMQEAMKVYRLRKRGVTQEEMVERGISAQRQKRALRLALAPDEILEGVREGDISVGAARKVGNMEAAMQKRCAEYFESAGELRHKDIKEIRRKAKTQEAESIGSELFEGAPSASDLEGSTEGTPTEGTPTEGSSSAGDSHGGDSHGEPSTKEPSTEPSTEPPTKEDPPKEQATEAIKEAVRDALESGHTARSVLRITHSTINQQN